MRLRLHKHIVKVVKEKKDKRNRFKNVPYYIALTILLVIILFSFVYSLAHISGDGFLRGKEVIIGSPVFGEINNIYVKTGDKVYQNEIVAEIQNYTGGITYLHSPISGEVVDVFKRQFETVTRGASIITVADRSNQYILAFFNPRDYNHIKSGMVVSIHMSNGTVCKGIIENINPVIYPMSLSDDYYGDRKMFFSVKIIPYKKFSTDYPYNMRMKIYAKRW